MAKVGKKLWAEVETPQGFSFVSDDICNWPDEQVVDFVKRNLANVRLVARIFGKIDRQWSQASVPRAGAEE